MSIYKINFRKIVITLLLFIPLLSLYNLLNLSTSSIGAIKRIEKGKRLNIVDEYIIDETRSFIVYQDDYQEYYVAGIKNIGGIVYKVESTSSKGIATSVYTDLEHLARYSGGYYIDYIFVRDNNIGYITIGNIKGIKEYKGNIKDVIDIKYRYKDSVIIKKVSDGKVCFWGKDYQGNLLECGLVTAFDKDGIEMYSETIY